MYLTREWFSPNLKLAYAILALSAIYALMIPFYGMHGVDDAWTLSFDYYYLRDGYEFGRIGGGTGVIAYFGKTHAFIYGLWAEIWGWERLPMRVLSTLLVIVAAMLWGAITWHFTRNKACSIAVVILCLLLDTFVSGAVKARPDALVYMLSALATWLACRRSWFSAALVISIAIETHPAAVIGFFIVLSVWLSEQSRFELSYIKAYLPRLIAGGTLGIAYYLSLHFEHLRELIPFIQGASSSNLSGRSFLYNHFFAAQYYRYLPNLLIFLAAYGWFYWKYNRNSQLGRFLHYATLGILLADFITGRGNLLYAIHAYPVFVILIVTVWQSVHQPMSRLIIAFYCLMLPQYTYLLLKNYDFYFPTYISLIKQHAQPHTIHIGHFAHWFAFNQEQADYFYTNVSPALVAAKRFVWIRDSVWEPLNARPSRRLKQIAAICPKKLLSSFTYAKHTVRFEQYDCRNYTEHRLLQQ